MHRTAIVEPGSDGYRRKQLTQGQENLYLWSIELHFSPDVEIRLQQVAAANGKNAGQLVKETVNRMLENQFRFIAGVNRGIAQADRGELVEHQEVRNRIDRLFHS